MALLAMFPACQAQADSWVKPMLCTTEQFFVPGYKFYSDMLESSIVANSGCRWPDNRLPKIVIPGSRKIKFDLVLTYSGKLPSAPDFATASMALRATTIGDEEGTRLLWTDPVTVVVDLRNFQSAKDQAVFRQVIDRLVLQLLGIRSY
jgi:hypothetical protein